MLVYRLPYRMIELKQAWSADIQFKRLWVMYVVKIFSKRGTWFGFTFV